MAGTIGIDGGGGKKVAANASAFSELVLRRELFLSGVVRVSWH